MFRVILYVIGFLIFTSVIRSVLGIIGKTLAAFSASAAANTSTHSNAGPSRQAPASGPSQNELKKDPVCGTFISTATAFQKAFGGETYYFCSAQCRDQFKA